jgi:hypothetical protein
MRSPFAMLCATVLISACAHQPVAYSALGLPMDGKRISVAGHLHISRGTYELADLCAGPRDGWNDGSCINLVSRRATRIDPPRDAIDSCVIAHGRFLAFGPGRIGMGNLNSGVGMIEVDRLVPCTRIKKRSTGENDG